MVGNYDDDLVQEEGDEDKHSELTQQLLDEPVAFESSDILENLNRLTRDVKEAAKQIDANEARFLVDLYYIMQKNRIHAANQIRSMSKVTNEPHSVINHLSSQLGLLERQTATALDIYTDNHPIGQWMKSIVGIGPVLSAGLLAHIDIKQAPTAGHIWSYAGMDPRTRWVGSKEVAEIIKDVLADSKTITDEHLAQFSIRTGRNLEYIERNKLDKKDKLTRVQMQKILSLRPWNAKLKTLCWKIGQSFVKVSNNKNDVYGKLYRMRKLYEIKNNELLMYKDQANLKLKIVGKGTEAYKSYILGKLPPAHIQARAERYAVKIFLSHLQWVWWKYEFKEEPPAPYAIDILGHSKQIPIPNLHIIKFD